MPGTINPFSKGSKRIVKNAPPLVELPGHIFEEAIKKVLWKKSHKRPPREILFLEGENDVLSYHVLFLSAGLNFSPYSLELGLVKDIVYSVTNARLMETYKTEGEKFRWRFEDKFEVEEVSTGGIGPPEYKVKWKFFLPLVSSKEMRLTEWDVSGGYIFSNRARLQKNRKLTLMGLSDMYSRLIAVQAFQYMSSISGKKEKSPLEISESLKGIAKALSEISEESFKSGGFLSKGKPKKFAPENFPPCIRGILRGATSGSRNYAICVLLTSFLSYARAAPGKVENPLLSDFIKDQNVLSDEIMPLILGAAERCQPPLFEDQPLEKMNVSYHLGLGLSGEAKLENSGSSKWYVPPNCEKIRRESPALCRPDNLCRRIKNPLNYYFIKMKGAEDEGGDDREKTEETPAPSEDNI